MVPLLTRLSTVSVSVADNPPVKGPITICPVFVSVPATLRCDPPSLE